MKFSSALIILLIVNLVISTSANLLKSIEPNNESKLVQNLINEQPTKPSSPDEPQTSTYTPTYEQQTASNEAQLVHDLEKNLAKMKMKQMMKRPRVIEKKYLVPNQNNFLFMFDDFNRFDLILRGGNRENNQVLVEVKFRVVRDDFLERRHKTHRRHNLI